jgi:2-polyprenyl-3-methyl-5-hydroxy-6-metoxy-1,4-benzoquinol methylase
MASDNNTKWDKRFRGEDFALGTDPSPYLAANIGFIKSLVPCGKVLDIACGEGRNSIFLASEGFEVTGIDISEAGLEKASSWMERENLRIDFRREDLEKYEITETYDLIINFNFLLRDLIPKEVAALRPGGVIVFDSILDSPYVPTTHKKEFLLRPGELYSIFSAFPGKIFFPEERLHDRNPTAKLIFQKSP